MQTRTRNAIALAIIGGLLALGLFFVWRSRSVPDIGARSLDAVPNGALLVAVVDLRALRASPIGAPLFREGREIPGIGRVRDVCGFDPIDNLRELAISIPAAGESGDFGVVGTGALDPDGLLTCASKVIEARGGRAVVTTIGSFKSVRDATSPSAGGEIAVRGAPGSDTILLLGGGAYLRAMIDSADGRAPTIRASVTHAHLGKEVQDGAVRVTVVLTPEQRTALTSELSADRAATSPLTSVVAGAASLRVAENTVALHAVLACEAAEPCRELAGALKALRDERAADLGVRLVGFGAVLEKIRIEPEGELVHARVELPADQASVLVDRLMNLRGLRHPMPDDRASLDAMPNPDGTGSPAVAPAPDAVVRPRDRAAGDASSRPVASARPTSSAPRPKSSGGSPSVEHH